MKRALRFIPVYTLFAGLVCAVFQFVLFLQTDESGLLPDAHFANTGIYALTGLMLVFAASYALFGSKKDFRSLLNFPLQAIGCVFAAGGILLWILLTPDSLLFTLFKGLCAGCFAALAFYRFRGRKPPLLFFALLTISLSILCFGQYRQWRTYTQLQGYMLPALAILFCVLYSLQFLMAEARICSWKRLFFCNQLALFSCLSCLSSDLWPVYLGLSVWLISGLFTAPYKMELPSPVQKLLRQLEAAGHSGYAVGGCVRDTLLGLTPADYDLCTDATPQQLCEIFSSYSLVRQGEKHGTIGVVLDGSVYEITTFRTETTYSDNRHPDDVEFVDNVQADLARRDFTVNAIAYHPKSGYTDPFGGQKDLLSGVLRTVGNPEDRFQEDALRILRGVRFACRFRLEVDPATQSAMNRLSPLMENLAAERVYTELTKTLCYMQQADFATFRDVLVQVLPELQPAVGFQQHSRYHAYDVYTHTAAVVANTPAEPALRWAAVLHDAGKPQTFSQDEQGQGHFFGHAQTGAQLAEGILLRLKAPTALRQQVVFLIAHHMDDITADKALLRRKLSKYGAEDLKMLVQLQRADLNGKGVRQSSSEFDRILSQIEALEKQEGRLQIRDLAIDGHQLMALGFEAGPRLGQCQQQLLQLVLEGKLQNNPQALTEKAKEILESEVTP